VNIPDWRLEYTIKIVTAGKIWADDIPDVKFVRYNEIAKQEIEKYKEIIYSEASRLDRKIRDRMNQAAGAFEQASSADAVRDVIEEAQSAPEKMAAETSLSINNALRALPSAIEVQVQREMAREARQDEFLSGARIEVAMKIGGLVLTVSLKAVMGSFGANPLKLIGATSNALKLLMVSYKECREYFRTIDESRDNCLKAVAVAKRKYDSGLNQIILAALEDGEKKAKKLKGRLQGGAAFPVPLAGIVSKAAKAYYTYNKWKDYDPNGLVDQKALKKAFYDFGCDLIEPIDAARKNYEVKVIKLRQQSDEVSVHAEDVLKCARDNGIPLRMRNEINIFHAEQQRFAIELSRSYAEHMKILAHIDSALRQMGEDPEQILRNKYFDGLTDYFQSLVMDRTSAMMNLGSGESLLLRLAV